MSLLFHIIIILSVGYTLSLHQDSGKTTIHVNIDQWTNNKAFGSEGNFDGVGTFFLQNSLHNSDLPVNYKDMLVNKPTNMNDNIQQPTVNNIVIPLQQKTTAMMGNVSLGALYMLVSCSHGPCTLNVDITYSDATSDVTTLGLPDWQDQHIDQMERYQAIQYPLSNGNQGALFSVPIYINPAKVPASMHIPSATGEATMHIFAIAGYTTQSSDSLLIVPSVRPTGEWINDQHQVVQVRLHNVNSKWVQDARVQILSAQVSTIEPGYIKAVAPGHTHTVRVVIQSNSTSVTNRTVVSIECSYNIKSKSTTAVTTTHASLSLQKSSNYYNASSASVQQHRPPNWLKQSKFGIFIHWGLYSVPSWAPAGKSYAEWYWWRMNHKDDAAYEYHYTHYGESFEYDDFLAQWKPTDFDPHNWLDLITQSRAKYFVFTTKHHDGIALFDTNVTDRSTMHLLHPNRNFVQELMNTAEKEYPHLRRGLYFSLPEWYHPKYKDDSLGWQGPPINRYTGQRVVYTGSRTIDDFVNELQVPQLQELIQYKPDILWCDIGGIHNSSVWQSTFFNQALTSGKQVAVNDRCGDTSASDFTTIEYKAVTDTPTRFWEATRGIDPYSFGYNQETTPDAYASPFDLITNLVDAVSRGGNFLLNIGPKASGSVPQPMVDRLIAIGSWLEAVDESIFDTVPYWITYGSALDNLKFTASEDGGSVYVFFFAERNSYNQGHQTLEITTPLPIHHSNSTIILLNNKSIVVQWQSNSKGNILLDFDLPYTNSSSPNVLVFKISYLL